jgi:23S rRNA 5-hydroxycytidine C2501 synthase
MTIRTELLAPARDLVGGKVAIDAGADAVYIGAPRFGARARAGNELDDIAALVEYAHPYWARVYVTVNTLLRDEELEEARALIWRLHAMEVDGIIIQDVGLLETDLPPIPLIASTQMHNATPEQVRFLEQIGFRRAILARELSLSQIREIGAAARGIELEAFVHGALCVSYSGQCTLSYALGGRSGNRGDCAQPCRRTYSIVDYNSRPLVKNRYLLSLRDMNRIADLGDMLDAGVTSFKIEGRLKDELYVANVVSAYRQALDKAMAETGRETARFAGREVGRASSGRSEAGFVPNLDKTFNRGYTPYFLHGRGAAGDDPRDPTPGDLSPGSIDTPKMAGEPVGVVVAVTAREFTLKPHPLIDLKAGDGIAYFDAAGRLRGTVVNRVEPTKRGLIITPNVISGIAVRTEIRRNHDHIWLNKVRDQMPVRSIGVLFTLIERSYGFELQVEDEDGNTASGQISVAREPARNLEQAVETAQRQLAKTGGTQYHSEGVILEWSQPTFLPISALNDLRRLALDALTAIREASRPVPTEPPVHSTAAQQAVPYPTTTLDFRGNALNARAVAFYRRHGVTEIEPAAESGLDMHGRVVMTTRYCIKEELGWCPRQGKPPKLEDPLFLEDEDNHRYALRFRCREYPACGMDITY